MLNWKKDIEKLHKAGCTDSDIEDYVDLHFTELNGKDVFDYYYELDAPECCKGCKHIQMSGMHPCINCSRPRTDYYESN